MKGEMKLKQLAQALYEQLGELEDQYGITFSAGATLYVNPTDGEGGTVQARERGGKPVNKLISKGPYRAAADEFNI
ncbi:hypothetical protein ACO0LM_22170 [Undibacterium sp. Di26W]|uniref:hypothetical protein n=1 Tax=Undibacterium sp. Di26W TaxID=3413035 RepID=UPI003BF2D020